MNMLTTSNTSSDNLISETQKKEVWTVDDFKNIQSIGGGKFGKVFKAIEKNSNK